MLSEEVQLKYAQLILRKGVNIQKNQPVYITAPIEGVDFVRHIVKEAYELGASNVHVQWEDDELTLLKYTHASEEVLRTFPAWAVQQRESFAKDGAAFISIYASDPDLLQQVDPKRVSEATKASGKALANFRNYIMNDKVRWTVVSIPTAAWAQKIFPGDCKEEAKDKLWQEIIKMVCVDQEDPLQVWDEHNATLRTMRERLTKKQYKKLILTAPGTHLEVGLPEGHIWHGGEAVSEDGNQFNPNMPTEEVFSMPHKYKVNGKVSSTKPLHYGGNVIDQLVLTFKDGAVVDYSAKQGEEVLAELLETDEGAKRLGEIALVPHESPVSQSGLIFYNTLFDENASCHLAFGKAYPTNIAGGSKMDETELDQHGVNDSIVHVDFMIGSEQLNIDGVTKDGHKEAVFRNGTWAETLK